jgi:hypothetical protein
MYYEKRRMQIAADAGALGGAWEVVRRHTDLATEIRPAAVNDTSHNGYSNANSTITVNYPPASGPQAANNRFVEVIIERQVPTTFMRVLNFTQTTVRARAVAGAVNIGDACVIALNPSAGAALNIRGTAEITADCGAMSNSGAVNGFQSDGVANARFSWAGVTGSYVDNGGGGSMIPTPYDGVPPILDPLDYLEPPDWSTWPAGFYDAATLTYKCPGNQCVFNTKLEIAGPAGVKTLDPGFYVLRDGIEITSTNIVNGTDITLYNTGEGFGFRFAGQSQVNLTAPTSGPYKGILLWMDKSAPGMVNELGRGDATFTWQGAIYGASQAWSIEGSSQGANPWALLIGDTIDFAGEAPVTFNAPPGNQAPELLRAALVE